MELHAIERGPDAFQQSASADEIRAMSRHVFGGTASVLSATELEGGSYNNTYRVDLGADRPVILRVAPEPARQFRTEREWMRNEHASVPYLAPIASLMPRTLAIDFTHEVIGRDYMFQTLVEGTPAPQGLRAYPRPQWDALFRSLGTLARRIHGVRGSSFGPVAGPASGTWADALIASFEDMTADLEDAGLDASDVRQITAEVSRQRSIFDEITEPRLLHGDLWVGNLLIEEGAQLPTVTGLVDSDRTLWGDPEADWPIHVAGEIPYAGGFWETYGSLPSSPTAHRRRLFYRARHIGATRLERHRLGKAEKIPATHEDMRQVLVSLGIPTAAATPPPAGCR